MMEVTHANPAGLAEPLGQYSHLSQVGGLLFVAGQVGIRPDGSLAGSGFEAQMRQVFANLKAVLASAGAGFSDILKFTFYLTDPAQTETFFAVRRELFRDLYPSGAFPSSTLLVIHRLGSPDFLLEIDAIAHVGHNAQTS